MGIEQALLSSGYVPKGVAPKIEQERYHPLDNIFESAQGFLAQQEEREKRTAEKKKNQADTYKTLRDSGYSSEKAYEAIQKGQTIAEPDSIDTPPPRKKGSGFTAEQGSKRRIGKQHILKKIQGWGSSGQVSDKDGDKLEIADEAGLNQYFIDQSELSPYYDLDDKDIQTSITQAIKRRKGVDLKKEAKAEKKPLVQKIKEFFSPKEKVKENVIKKNSAVESSFNDQSGLIDAIKKGSLKPGTPFMFQGKLGEWIDGRPAIRE